MPGTGARERRRVALRETILDAARGIVRSEGLRGLTMRRIAEAVDYAPSSLYAHFESRETLLATLCREGFAALRAALETSIANVHDPKAQLATLATAYVRFALDHPETYRLIFMEDAALTRGVFESFESDDALRALGLIAAPLVTLRANGMIRKSIEPARLVDVLWTFVHGIASLRLSCADTPATDDATLIATALSTIIDGARPRSKAP